MPGQLAHTAGLHQRRTRTRHVRLPTGDAPAPRHAANADLSKAAAPAATNTHPHRHGASASSAPPRPSPRTGAVLATFDPTATTATPISPPARRSQLSPPVDDVPPADHAVQSPMPRPGLRARRVVKAAGGELDRRAACHPSISHRRTRSPWDSVGRSRVLDNRVRRAGAFLVCRGTPRGTERSGGSRRATLRGRRATRVGSSRQGGRSQLMHSSGSFVSRWSAWRWPCLLRRRSLRRPSARPCVTVRIRAVGRRRSRCRMSTTMRFAPRRPGPAVADHDARPEDRADDATQAGQHGHRHVEDHDGRPPSLLGQQLRVPTRKTYRTA